MRRISSKMTFFNKRIFPALWFGIIALFVGAIIFAAAQSGSAPTFAALVFPAILAIAGFSMMRRLLFDLADEAWDDGNSLLIKNAGQEQRIELRDIKNISYTPYMNPARVTLSLRRPTAFGNQVTFAAPARFIPFATNPLINDLIDRVDAAREK